MQASVGATICASDRRALQASSSGRKREEAVDDAVGAIEHWLPGFDVMVVGPGLGRDELVHDTVVKVHFSMHSIFLNVCCIIGPLYH